MLFNMNCRHCSNHLYWLINDFYATRTGNNVKIMRAFEQSGSKYEV
jgi:hypothetical protein